MLKNLGHDHVLAYYSLEAVKSVCEREREREREKGRRRLRQENDSSLKGQIPG